MAVYLPVRELFLAVEVTDDLTLLRLLIARMFEDCWLLTVKVVFLTADCEAITWLADSFLVDEATIFEEDFWTDDCN